MLKTIPTVAALASIIVLFLAQGSTAADRGASRVGDTQPVHPVQPVSRAYHLIGAVNAQAESVLYSFRSGADGTNPIGAPIADAEGALYGTTAGGGAISGGAGTVYKLTPVGNGYSEEFLYRFHGTDGASPFSSLLADSTGDLFGTTYSGGAVGLGTVFELTPSGNTYIESVLYSFQGGADGSHPYASVIADSAGALYGTTSNGGPANVGTVFRLTPNANGYSESVLYSFQNTGDGGEPFSALLADASGALFGTTYAGGHSPSNGGTVFKLTPTGNTYAESILYSFQGGADGSNPWGSVIADNSGALYGTTLGGGSAGLGTAYKLTPNGNGYDESILYSFRSGTDGNSPSSSLIADGSGALYGTTGGGGGKLRLGTVFKLTPGQDGYSESILYRFLGGSDGSNPGAALIIDNTGSLYGSTNGNSNNRPNNGSVFKLKPNGNVYDEVVLHSFHWQADGSNPEASLIGDASGALYGTTNSGGAAGQGTVFEMLPKGSSYNEIALYRFQGKPDGAFPVAGLIEDKAGALYGTTQYGGIGDKEGTVFKLTPTGNSYTESVLYSFLGSPDGYGPLAPLIADASGALYGTTSHGGNGRYGFGTVFKLKPKGTGYSESVLFRFGGPSGTYPAGALIEDSFGSLYGTTSGGGATGYGTVFKLRRSGGTYSETIIHNFRRHADGAFPGGGLIADNAGALYGTTAGGGSSGQGTVFELSPVGNGYSETILYSFMGGTDGDDPNGSLIADSTGALYGTTGGGGSAGYGTVFKLTPSGGSYSESILYSFMGGTNGNNPNGSLIADGTGALYGTTGGGGKLGQGTVFKLIP